MVVDKKTKKFDFVSLYPSKSSWNFSKEKECNNIIKEWHMTFKSSDLKRKNFLYLLNNNLSEIRPFYIKEDLWIKYFSFSNLLCAHAIRAITNPIPIEEYHLRFFLREEFKCLCRFHPIKSRCYIFYKCKRFNRYWNLIREIMNYIISFLEFNPNKLAVISLK